MDEDKIVVSYPGNYHCAGNLFTKKKKKNPTLMKSHFWEVQLILLGHLKRKST
jgi:hypothetical protein